MGMRMNKFPLDDIKARQSIMHAVNKQEIVEGAFWQLGLQTPQQSSQIPPEPIFQPASSRRAFALATSYSYEIWSAFAGNPGKPGGAGTLAGWAKPLLAAYALSAPIMGERAALALHYSIFVTPYEFVIGLGQAVASPTQRKVAFGVAILA